MSSVSISVVFDGARRSLPSRTRHLVAQVRRFSGGVWDVNSVVLARVDAGRIAAQARQLDHPALAVALDALERQLDDHLGTLSPPDDAAASALEQLAADVDAALPVAPEPEPLPAIETLADELELGEALLIGGNLDDYAASLAANPDATSAASPGSASPPLSLSLVEPSAVADEAARSRPAAAPLPDAPAWALSTDDDIAIAAQTAQPTRAPELVARDVSRARGEPAAPIVAPAPIAEANALYLLSGAGAFADAVGPAFAAAGYEVHRFDAVDELIETLGALLPAVVVTGPDLFDGLESVTLAVNRARRGATAPLALIVTAVEANIPTRLAVMRAGADALITMPFDAARIVARVAELRGAAIAEPYRVMIVEDDRSQALFAESILSKSGIVCRTLSDPLAALDALEVFKPELILMDLLMPGCNGIELTTLIRERDQFADVPIVFLSGDQSADRRYDALAVGGDDFLEKPIKPKFLLSAVTNRLKRSRAQSRRGGIGSAPGDGARVPHLHDRARLLERAGEALIGSDTRTAGGLLFVIIDGAQSLRERVGLIAFDRALQQAGLALAAALPDGALAARYGDSSFALVDTRGDRAALEALAIKLERRFAEGLVEGDGASLKLTSSTGIALFSQGWRDASALIDGAERAASRARSGGGSRHVVSAGPDIKATDDADAVLRNATLSALANDGITLVYQPIASLHGRVDELYQALLRLRDAGGRRYSAAEIVPMAERSGLVEDVDRAVLERAAKVLGDRIRGGRRTALFVSQSAQQLGNGERAAWLAELTQRHGIAPAQLILEWRHEDLVATLAAAATEFAALKSAGFKVALGAFEPTANTRASLAHLAFDYLRISGRFIAQLDASRSGELRALVGDVHARGAEVVAPMVEDARTAAALWGTGVDFIQGDFVHQASTELGFDFRAASI